jgi:AcrR family transcriptional regulator
VYHLTNRLINTEVQMKAALSKPRLGSRGRPEESRAAILQAAIREFSREGVAGARTDAIARAAGVNKALLYYYFKDKEELLFEAVKTRVGRPLAQLLQLASRPIVIVGLLLTGKRSSAAPTCSIFPVYVIEAAGFCAGVATFQRNPP